MNVFVTYLSGSSVTSPVMGPSISTHGLPTIVPYGNPAIATHGNPAIATHGNPAIATHGNPAIAAATLLPAASYAYPACVTTCVVSV